MYRIGEAARRGRRLAPPPCASGSARAWFDPREPAPAIGSTPMPTSSTCASIRRLRQVDRLNAAGHPARPARAVPPARRMPTGRLDGRPAAPRPRRSAGLSLREASERSGLSISFISALERGVSGASVATLQRLTAAYGTTMLELFGAPDDGTTRPARAGRRSGASSGSASADVRIEQLARGARQLEPQLFVLAPGATSDGAYAHEGEEFIYLLSGAVTVWVGDDETYVLDREGDALTFPSTLPHRWRNDAGGESRLLWINTPPTF